MFRHALSCQPLCVQPTTFVFQLAPFCPRSASRISDIVVGVGPTAYVEADHDTAAREDKQTHQDVHQRDGPEGKQVDCLVTVGIDLCRGLVIVGFIDGVDPHITRDKPAEDKERHQGVPAGAESVQRGGSPVLWFPGTGQAGKQAEEQAEHPHHHQVNGDVVLLGAVLQVNRTNGDLSNGEDTCQRFGKH